MLDLFETKEIISMWEDSKINGFYTKKFFENFTGAGRSRILAEYTNGQKLITSDLISLMMELRFLEIKDTIHNDNGVIESKTMFED